MTKYIAYTIINLSCQVENMFHLFYGSLGILAWKCGTQLQKEVRHVNPSSLPGAPSDKETKKKSKFAK